MKTEIEVTGQLGRIIFEAKDSDFQIATLILKDVKDIKEAGSAEIVVKGEMSLLNNTDYIFRGELIVDKRYGNQYKLISIKRKKLIESLSKEEFRDFLYNVAGETKVDAIYATFEDPRKVFAEGAVDKLKEAKGIGDYLAKRYIEIYEEQKDYGKAYVEYAKWGFTPSFTRKVVKDKGSVEIAISILKRNPYDLMGVQGIGFKTIDAKALEKGIKPNDMRRVRAFIANYFEELAMDGNSWIGLLELVQYLKNEIYECDIDFVVRYLNESDKYKIYNRNGLDCVSSINVFNTEQGIARELLRIMLGKNNMKLTDSEEVVKTVEQRQGWEYSPEQMAAIRQMVKYNVFLLQGLAGTGKSSVMNAFVQMLQKHYYEYKQCALSGKAAQNLAGITGKKGSTIHRLLGYGEGGFSYNERNKLPTDVVILDEISMVDIDIFYSLLKAIPNGAKLIMLGDSGQLDSIGVGVMDEMIKSKVIPSTTLVKIHRQAQDSAMITHSVAFRNGKYPTDLKTKAKTRKIYGVKRDLGYTFVSSQKESKISSETMMIYKTLVKKYGVNDLQIITPTISSGVVNCDQLNDACQLIVNPKSESKAEIKLEKSKDRTFIIREGDKVINTKNNMHTEDAEAEDEVKKQLPIFNGNTGIVESIEMISEKAANMIVNFDGVGRVRMKTKDIMYLQLGYAITVHKAQGSSIPCVLVALPFQFKLDSRELLYTAITRARHLSYIVTSPRTLKYSISKTSKQNHHNNLGMLLKLEAKKYIKQRKGVTN